MGLVKKGGAEDAKAPEAEAPEDPPVVKQLKEIDDRYLELEKEYDREVQKLVVKYTGLQQPLLQERKEVLLSCEGEGAQPQTGTPALAGFWLKALQNHPAFDEDLIQEWDEPVLEYLQDIEKSHVDEEDSNKGFKLVFHFAENPYFSNKEVEKVYTSELANPYCGEIEVKEVKSTVIEWKAGKDVTVEKVAKKVKGGGAKKAKQKKEKEEPRPSFFREFFRNLKEGMSLPEDAREQARMMADEDDEEEDDDDDEELVRRLMDEDHDIGMALRDNIIPFAVRWYTGEAAPEEEDDDEDDEEDEEEDDDDDEDEDPSPKAKGRGRVPPKKKPAKSSPSASPEQKPAEAPKEECKQQ